MSSVAMTFTVSVMASSGAPGMSTIAAATAVEAIAAP